MRIARNIYLMVSALGLAVGCASASAGGGAQGSPVLGAPAEPGASAAATAPAPEGSAGAMSKVQTVEGITEYRLANGLKVLLYPDQSKPTLTVNITFFVGSRHEGYGETGMAHLLEHMVFKGTPRHPDVWKLLQDRGAQFNGTTWYDRTNYYEELPASPANLEFAIALEADRMVNSRIAKEDLAKEFSVVRNEFEMGENNPAGVLEEKIFSAAFQWHNYGKTTIGSRSDIEKVPVENLKEFYRKHYQPDNAMLIVAGKFDEAKALELVQRNFGAIPRPTRRLQPTWTEEPVQDGERQVTLRRTGDVAVVAALYHGVAGADPDWIASDAVADVLTNKPAGRLYKALVEKGLASEVFGYVYPTAEPGVIYVGAKVRPGGSPEKVRDVFVKVVEELGSKPVTDAEIERWRSKSLKEFELALTETATVGVALSDWAAMGDWRLFFLTRDRVKTVKAADVTRVAQNYLRASNRTLGMFVPTKAPERSPAPPRVDVAQVMKDFKPSEAVSAGEVFLATIDNVEKRTSRDVIGPKGKQTAAGPAKSGLELALLPKKTKGGAVRVLMTVRYGDEKSLQGKAFLGTVLPSMLMRGTKKHTFQQLKDQFDNLKAEVNFGASTEPGVAQVRIKTMKDNLPAVLSLVIEALQEPAFPKPEFETLRKELLARYEEQLQDPVRNGMTTLMQKVSPAPKTDVRYILSMAERIEALKKMTVADLSRMHKSLWGASTTQVAVVGDFDPAAIKAQLEKQLVPWKSPTPYARITQPYKPGLVENATVNTPDKQMSLVAVGHPLEMRDDDPEYPTLVLLNHVLGGSASSRLLNRLRQKEGLSYGAFSDIDARALDKSGIFFAGAICAPENADKAMGLMLEEITKLQKEGISPQELADAKKSYAANFDTMLADDDFVSGELTKGLYLDRTFAFQKKVNDRIQAVTAADLQGAAQKYIKLDKLVKVKAGDLSKASAKAS
jgi:zinc protease